jgi:DNA-binding NtrC family response regulator
MASPIVSMAAPVQRLFSGSDQPPDTTRPGAAPDNSQAQQARRILVVDDESRVADSVAEILNESGFNAIAAYSGKSALEIVRDVCPQVLLCDLLMPHTNGVQTALAVREICPDVRVVLFSGHAATIDLLSRAKAQGLEFEFLPKPIHPDELVRRLTR